jgi:Protein of unknown function (DUF2750)
MRNTTQDEVAAVIQLDGPARFRHFCKRAAEELRVWGLRGVDGWALLGTHDAQPTFPLWPAREYAELFQVGDWQSYAVTEISLEQLRTELLPLLEEDGILPSIFPVPGSRSVIAKAEHLLAALDEELLASGG